MYADTDFILALVKEDDWLEEPAEQVYRENKNRIWTSRYVLLEIFMVAYREGWDTRELLANIEELIEVRDPVEEIFKASVKVEEDNLTPIDAINIIVSGEDKILSSDQDYDRHTERLKLEERKSE